MVPIYTSPEETPPETPPSSEQSAPFSKPAETVKTVNRPINFKAIDNKLLQQQELDSAKPIKDTDLDMKGFEKTKEF